MTIREIIKNHPALYYGLLQMRRQRELKRFRALDDRGRRAMVEKQYLAAIGRPLRWDTPEAYTEKMQWEKLYHPDARKVRLADKYLVRDWVRERIGEEYLIPLLGVWDHAEEIDFAGLPAQFVLKTNCGSGDAAVVKDKTALTEKQIRAIRRKMAYYLHYDHYATSCEMHYADIPPKIIAEAYIDPGHGDLPDYKFICFDGKPYFCWVDMDRFTAHRRNIYDLDWHLQPWHQTYPGYEGVIEKPENFAEMIALAEKLSQGFAHVRVDLYNVRGKIYFGEMTFTSETGYGKITPDETDFALGKLWNIK